MRAITLDYISRPFSIGSLALFVVAAVTLISSLYRHFELENKIDRLETQKYKLQKEQKLSAPPQRNQTVDLALKSETERANEIIRQLVLPWDKLFIAVESAANETTAILSIQPDPEKASVQIAAEAKDFSSMVAFTKRLQSDPVFADCYLSNHQIQQQDPQKPVRFSVTATWKSNR